MKRFFILFACFVSLFHHSWAYDYQTGPGLQIGTQRDLDISIEIRRELQADSSLSSSAKNVVINTTDGVVTLKGTVTNDIERDTVVLKARSVSGVNRVINQLSVVYKSY